MSPALPLSEASKRLRQRPGRPRKTRPVPVNRGHTSATGPAHPRMNSGPPGGAPAYGATAPLSGPRLLDIPGAAAYLGLSAWTIREYLASGILGRVALPSATRGTTRRVLLDRLDLDRLVEQSKDGAESPRSPA